MADALAQLPEACGGRSMALNIAELARAGQVPEWGQGLRPQCVPADYGFLFPSQGITRAKSSNRFAIAQARDAIFRVRCPRMQASSPSKSQNSA